MKNSEDRRVPVAAVTARRQTAPKNQTECWRVASFVRKPQIEPVTPVLHSPRQSSLIKPNQAILCLDAIHSQPPSCSKIPTSPILLRQTPSKPVKAGQSISQSLPPSHGSSRNNYILWSTQPNCTTYGGLHLPQTPLHPANPQFPSNLTRSVLSDRSDRFPQSAIRNSS